MKAGPATLWPDPARPDLGVGLSGFASRNATALHRRLAAEDPQGWWVGMGWLSDYVSATGRPPSRSVDPVALVGRSKRWMALRLVAEDEARRVGLRVEQGMREAMPR